MESFIPYLVKSYIEWSHENDNKPLIVFENVDNVFSNLGLEHLKNKKYLKLFVSKGLNDQITIGEKDVTIKFLYLNVEYSISLPFNTIVCLQCYDSKNNKAIKTVMVNEMIDKMNSSCQLII